MSPIKYYLYISDSMLDMLYPQIPEGRKRTIAKELKIDLKLVSFSLKENPGEDNRAARLRLVTEHIRRHHQVGKLGDGPAPWLAAEGDVPLRMATVDGADDVVMFAGTEGGNLIGLFGTAHHMPAGTRDTRALARGTHAAIMELQQRSHAHDSSFDFRAGPLEFVEDLAAAIPANERPMEFLAKMEQFDKKTRGTEGLVFLARPIYVALSF